ncbi:hypothetical protein PG996_005836 [Apiospora saccharicola]|uniref:Uncharacterized protein n=1 Tax=Apiospora saccharicola TaxID=335842 RepID=A0ABR1VMQ5_9PEZI
MCFVLTRSRQLTSYQWVIIPTDFTANVTAQSSLTNTSLSNNSTPTTMASGPSTDSDHPKLAPDSGGEKKSQAWISGPAVGSVAGVAFILVAAMLLFQKKKKKTRELQGGGNDPEDKPQLHSDCIPKSELENIEKRAPVELPETYTIGVTNEVHELPDIRNPAELEASYTTAQAPPGQLITAGDRQDG